MAKARRARRANRPLFDLAGAKGSDTPSRFTPVAEAPQPPIAGSPQREGAPRGSFLSHLALPDLFGAGAAVLRGTVGPVAAGEPVVTGLGCQRRFPGRLPPHDGVLRLRRLHRMRPLALLRHALSPPSQATSNDPILHAKRHPSSTNRPVFAQDLELSASKKALLLPIYMFYANFS